jgi:hypothetical protein
MDTKRNKAEHILDEVVLSNLNKCPIVNSERAKMILLKEVSYRLDSKEISLTLSHEIPIPSHVQKIAQATINSFCDKCNLMELHQPIATAKPVEDRSGIYNPSINIQTKFISRFESELDI